MWDGNDQEVANFFEKSLLTSAGRFFMLGHNGDWPEVRE
jgi:hypothetical protein